MNSDTLIEIDHVTFGYDPSRTILDDISLSFARGKVTAILGGSGCGKTTLLRLIGGMVAVNRGKVMFDGELINARDRAKLLVQRRRMGMLFQFGALFTDLTVFDTVAYLTEEELTMASKDLEGIGYDPHSFMIALTAPPSPVDYCHSFIQPR